MKASWIPGVALLTWSAVAGAQGSTVVGIVVSQSSGEPLSYSIVALPTLGRERFATDAGVFSFDQLPPGTVPIRIRRLGYAPRDTIVTVGAQSDTIRIGLSRVILELGGITVTADPPCLTPGPPAKQDSALAVMFDQIRMNAEQYKFLSEQYPFYYLLDITRSSRQKSDGQLRIDSHVMQRVDAKSPWRYRPGRVLERQGLAGWRFYLPTLVDLADRAFLDHHCFHFGGTERINDTTLVKVRVVAAERIKDPDVNGTIYVDPETFQVRRTVLRLSRITPELRQLLDFEAATEFREVLPSIPIIALVTSVQTVNADSRLSYDLLYEVQKLAGYTFLKRKPGDDIGKVP